MKKLQGLIILLLVHTMCLGQVNLRINNGGKAATQEYVKLLLESLMNRIDTTGGTTPTNPTDPTTPTNPTPVCSGPTITGITAKSQTSLTFTWSGLNVPDIVWNISNGTGIVRQGSASSSSPTITVNYNQIGYGEYFLYIKGIGCPTTPNPVAFTLTAPPVVASSGLRIYMNTTGYGFDPTDQYGINEEWRKRITAFNTLSYNGTTFSGINGVRLLVRWMDYEPTENNYNDAKLLAAMNYCKSRGLKFSVCFWGVRKIGDGFVPDGERVTGSNGELWILENDKYEFALYSQTGKEKLKKCVKHMAQVLAQYPNDTDYISLGFGETEEYYNPIIKSFNPSTHEIKNVALTGYSQAERTAWASYIASKGLAGSAPPVSQDPTDAFTTGDMWNTTVGKHWYEFITDGLTSVHAYFRDGVHEGGGKVCGFYADAGGAQSAWYMTYRLNKIFEGVDVIYSSEGGNQYSVNDKIYSADFNAGTFPNAEAAIEFDPEDLSTDGSTYYGNPTSSQRLLDYGSSFFKRGGKIIHFAMAFSYGDAGNNITTLAPALWTLQNDYVKAGNTVPQLPANPTVTYTLDTFKGDPYRNKWGQNGGNINTIVKIKLQ
jgi:hypothetical protein